MEKKKNVIVDGDFIQILYSTAEFEMNGLYVFAEFDTTQEKQSQNWTQIQGRPSNTQPHPLSQKKYIVFNPTTIENARAIQLLCQIESSIIDRYMQKNGSAKIASCILKTQLMNGIIKYHSENVTIHSDLDIERGEFRRKNMARDKIILKISGVWETTTHVGITMKFISLQHSGVPCIPKGDHITSAYLKM